MFLDDLSRHIQNSYFSAPTNSNIFFPHAILQNNGTQYEKMPISNSTCPLKDIDEVLDNDVMLGRGRGTNHHPGNKRFRAIVEEQKDQYNKASRIEKPVIALAVVHQVRALLPSGRFLKLDKSTGKWFDVGDKKAREKTSQALREPKKEGDAPPNPCTRKRRTESDSSNSSDSSHSTRNQMENEVVRKEPEPEKMQSIGTLDFSMLDVSHILDSQWESQEGNQNNIGDAAAHLHRSLVIADQVDEIHGVEPMGSDYLQLFATRNHSSDPIPPPMRPRAPSSQDHAVMKRETSNQEIYPRAKKRAFCCESKVATANYLKQLFMDQVQKNKMCMEEFLFVANKQMGRWERKNGDVMDQEQSSLPPRPPVVERTASEQFEYELLSSPQDFHQEPPGGEEQV